MPSVPDVSRQIQLLEKKEARVYEKAYDAYWNGPSWKVPALEAELAAIHRQLVGLEAMRER